VGHKHSRIHCVGIGWRGGDRPATFVIPQRLGLASGELDLGRYLGRCHN